MLAGDEIGNVRLETVTLFAQIGELGLMAARLLAGNFSTLLGLREAGGEQPAHTGDSMDQILGAVATGDETPALLCASLPRPCCLLVLIAQQADLPVERGGVALRLLRRQTRAHLLVARGGQRFLRLLLTAGEILLTRLLRGRGAGGFECLGELGLLRLRLLLLLAQLPCLLGDGLQLFLVGADLFGADGQRRLHAAGGQTGIIALA